MKTRIHRLVPGWMVAIALLCMFCVLTSASNATAAELKLPSGLRRIEEQAFYGDISLDTVVIADGTEVIESKAFARSSIRTVLLPASLYSIANDAFDKCENLTVNAQEGTYAYTWAVKNGYIKIPSGVAGEVTKVIAPDVLRAGSDLIVQVVGPEDTIHHSIYIVNEQTGEYQHRELIRASDSATFHGCNFDSGNTYRMTVYTVTKQYQSLTPVVKTIQVNGKKPEVSKIDMPDTLKLNQDVRVETDSNDLMAVHTEYYSVENELIVTYDDDIYYNEISLSTWQFYQNQEGGSIRLKYALFDGELWSEWSEEKKIVVVPLQYTVTITDFPSEIENGKDFGINFEYEGYADRCEYTICPEDTYDYLTGGECWLGSAEGTGSLLIDTRMLDRGSYVFRLYFYADGASAISYERAFKVVGDRETAPEVKAECDTAYVESNVIFDIASSGAEKVAIIMRNPSGGYDEYTENTEGRSHRWWNWVYDAGTYRYRFAVRRNGKWSAWSDDIDLLVKERIKLSSPSIYVAPTAAAGTDLTFRFDEVENATFYTVDLYPGYDDASIYRIEPATPTDLTEIPGYMLASGSYAIEVQASAEESEPSSQRKYFTVTGDRPAAPEVSVEEPLRSNEQAIFTVDTTGADALQVKYLTESEYTKSVVQYRDVNVTGDSSNWTYDVPRYGRVGYATAVIISFAVKRDGVWSNWNTKTYSIEGPPPLAPAVIYVDEVIQPKTSFTISVDPVENATDYYCELINSAGIVWHGYKKGPFEFNSEYYQPDIYTFRVYAYSNAGHQESVSERTFTIEGFPRLDPADIQVDDIIEAGKDFAVFIGEVENATSYEYQLYQGDQYISSGSGSSAFGNIRFAGYQFEPGEYQIRVYAYADDFTTSTSAKTITITGTQSDPPMVTVDKMDIFTEESCVFTINTEEADALVVKDGYRGPEGIQIQGNVTQWSSYDYIWRIGVLPYQFAVLKDGKWSQWSEPININVQRKPNLIASEVTADEEIDAGRDYTIRFSAVENATSYTVSFASVYGGGNLCSWGSDRALPDTELTVPGYLINAGSYRLNVTAAANGYESATRTIYITASGKRPAGPDVTVGEPLRVKSTALFTVNTEDAEVLQVKYQYTAPNNWWSEQQESIPTTGETTTWAYRIDEYYQGADLTVSFAAKINGIWSTWKTKTCTIEGLPPLEPAVISVAETVEAGKSVTVAVESVANATSYLYRFYRPDGSGYRQNDNTSISDHTYNGYDLEPGEYRIEVRAYSDSYATSISTKTFTVAGAKPKAPEVSVDKTEVQKNEQYMFTIDTTKADDLRCRLGSNSSYSINVLEDETQWQTSEYYTGNYEYQFTVRNGDTWSAWSEPITVHVSDENVNKIGTPEITVISEPGSGKDLVVSLSAVSDATSYELYLSKSDGTLIFNYTVYPQNIEAVMLPGYRIAPGLYTLSAYAWNGNGNGTRSEINAITITVPENEKPAAPKVTSPSEIKTGDYVSFAVNTTGADQVVMRSYLPGNTNDISYSARTVEDGQNEFEWSLYFNGSSRKYSFAVRRDSIWSEWSSFMILRETQPVE